jgi:hypothetical protein
MKHRKIVARVYAGYKYMYHFLCKILKSREHLFIKLGYIMDKFLLKIKASSQVFQSFEEPDVLVE